MRSRRSDWYEHIDGTGLTAGEQNGIEFFKSYMGSIHGRIAEKIDSETTRFNFDVDGFRQKVRQLDHEDPRFAVLSAVSIADGLLIEMFKRERRPQLEMSSLLGPMGPLGDFNKRLKIAAISDFISDDCLIYFDELRKIRNRIAHSENSKKPSTEEIRRVVGQSPSWLEAMREEPRLYVPEIDMGGQKILSASLAVNLSLLAWQSILLPLINANGIPLQLLIDRSAVIFTSTSAIGMGIAMELLGVQKVPVNNLDDTP